MARCSNGMAVSTPSVVSLLLTCILISTSTIAARKLSQASDAQALLALPAAVSNWETATAELPGAAWQAGTNPCSSASGGVPWKGVSCSPSGQVAELRLVGLGLQGTLPAQLADLSSLVLLDLHGNAFGGSIPERWMRAAGLPSLAAIDLGSNLLKGTLPTPLPELASLNISIAANEFSGTLPAAWSSETLKQLDLRNNSLSGTLPPEWGSGSGLFALEVLQLQGNNISGLLPYDAWDEGPMAEPATAIGVRPGNPGLCGKVLPIDPSLYTDAPAYQANTSQTTTFILKQSDLFTPGSSVTVTNFLGSCMTPCSDAELADPPAWIQAAGLPWPPVLQTSGYDISHSYNMSISDLLLLNPGLAFMQPGQNLSVPCFPPTAPSTALSQIQYYGGDVAFGMFAGGNQLKGPDGLQGAMAASRVVLNLPGTVELQGQVGAYTGSGLPVSADGGPGAVVEPVYWFVDLLAPFHVVSVFLTAGPGGLKNASIYVGSDSDSVFNNTLVASNVNVEAWQQLGVAANATVGRYAIVYTGARSEGQMSLADVQVYTYETNTAANMPIAASSLASIDQGGASTALQAMVDNNVSTCVAVQADPTEPSIAWVFVDLGYVATVSSVAVAADSDTLPGMTARVTVTRHADDTNSDDTTCGQPLQLVPGGWAVGGCNLTGRYVTFSVQTDGHHATHIHLCEVQVALAVQPQLPNDSESSPPTRGDVLGDGGNSTSGSGSTGLSGGTIAGIVVGAVLGSALLLCAAVLAVQYGRWRRRYIARQRQVSDALAASKGLPAHQSDSGGPPKAATNSDAASNPSDSQPAANDQQCSTPTVVVATGAGGIGTAGSGTPVSRPLSVTTPNFISKAGRRVSSEWEMLGRFTKQELGRSRDKKDLATAGPLPGTSEYLASLFSLAPTTNAASDSSSGSPVAGLDVSKLPPSLVDISPKDIQLIECIGEGSFGQVWRGRYFGAAVAVKVFASRIRAAQGGSDGSSGEPAEGERLELGDLKREAELMRQLRHPNICLYLGACQHPPSLVMQYCERKSLESLLSSARSSPQLTEQLTWARLLGMVLDAAKGMLYLHTRSPPIIHRDLKSANLLVDKNWKVLVADFNLSRALESNSSASTVVFTNPRWLAPEVMDGTPGQLASDVWAFGTVMWEVLTWQLPFAGLNTYQIITLVQREGSASLVAPTQEQLPAGPFAGLQQYVDLMQACRADDPQARPKFSAIVERLEAILEAEVQRKHAAAATAAAPRGVCTAASGAAYSAMTAMLKQRQMALQRQTAQQHRPQPVPEGAPDARPTSDGSDPAAIALSSAFFLPSAEVPNQPPQG